ncbi:substrate-binding periplasmic protein [Desulfobacter curvatus]|uniref:substrate-binding periplasmic protein n=1 Tax=Desulfobacter curvatus TaxID=2290 RepID=UPI000377AA15|nr:transporter substrate-binding domain-containing protein [Desulfobacter curvatus]
MKKQVIFGFCLLCLAVLPAHAQDLEIAVDNANPPFMYNDAGKAAGLYPAMLTAIFSKMNVPVKVSAYPWKRVLKMGKDGAAGIGGIYKNPDRLKIFDYSDSIFSERLVLFINKDKAFNYSGVKDLSGKKVGILLGWSYGADFDEAKAQKAFIAEEGKSDEANFKKLTQGWLDCVVAIELAGQKLIAQEKLQDKIVMSGTPVAINDTYLVFAKSLDKKSLLTQFNNALAGMKNDGSYDGIIKGVISD